MKVYRNQMRECAKCSRIVPKDQVTPSPGLNKLQCRDEQRCATRPPLYSLEDAAEQQVLGTRFVLPCIACNAIYTQPQYLALVSLAYPMPSGSLVRHFKVCVCGNQITRALAEVR